MSDVKKMDSASDNLALWGNLLWRLRTYSFDPADKAIWKFCGVPTIYFWQTFVLFSFAGKDIMKPLFTDANSEVIAEILL